jgi:N-glycosylase/DNA lyase
MPYWWHEALRHLKVHARRNVIRAFSHKLQSSGKGASEVLQDGVVRIRRLIAMPGNRVNEVSSSLFDSVGVDWLIRVVIISHGDRSTLVKSIP